MTCLSYLGTVFGPIRYLANTNFSPQYALAALQRVIDLFSTVPEENLFTSKQVEHFQDNIIFDRVSFSNAGTEPVL
jgi:ABC-type multidrug transport system fused ATPase/permease subunit